jgi:hypothetical protein
MLELIYIVNVVRMDELDSLIMKVLNSEGFRLGRAGSILVLYEGGPWFTFRSGDTLSLLRFFFVMFIDISRQMQA